MHIDNCLTARFPDRRPAPLPARRPSGPTDSTRTGRGQAPHRPDWAVRWEGWTRSGSDPLMSLISEPVLSGVTVMATSMLQLYQLARAQAMAQKTMRRQRAKDSIYRWRRFFLRTLGSMWSGMSPSRRPPMLGSGDQSV